MSQYNQRLPEKHNAQLLTDWLAVKTRSTRKSVIVQSTKYKRKYNTPTQG